MSPLTPQLCLVFMEAQTQHPQDGGQELDPQTHLEVITDALRGGRGRGGRGKGEEGKREEGKGEGRRGGGKRGAPSLSQHTDTLFPLWQI